MPRPLPAVIALALSFAAGPVLAQSTTNPPPGTAPAANPSAPAVGTATVSDTAGAPSQRNPLLADNGEVRMSKLIGTDVYDQQNQKVGSVDDVLMSSGGQPDVILSTNDKMVQVPWNKLTFGDAKLNSHNKVILQGENQQALNQQPAFKYTNNH